MTPEQEHEILDAVTEFIARHKDWQARGADLSRPPIFQLPAGMNLEQLQRIKQLVDAGIYNEGF